MSNIESILILILSIIGVLLIISYFVRKNTDAKTSRKIENNNQKSVKCFLKKVSRKKGYKLLSNISLHIYDSITNIDHIIIGEFGILVVATKGLNGEIFGTSEEKNWTHIVKNEKHTLYNPLMQNQECINSIKNILKSENIYNVDIHSLVVFAGKKIELNVPPTICVITSSSLSSYFKKSFFKKQSNFDIDKVYNAILKYKVTDNIITHNKVNALQEISNKG